MDITSALLAECTISLSQISVCVLMENRVESYEKKLVWELGRHTAVNNDCLSAQEILDAVITGCNMGQICPQGQHWINQHRSNQAKTHTHTHIEQLVHK